MKRGVEHKLGELQSSSGDGKGGRERFTKVPEKSVATLVWSQEGVELIYVRSECQIEWLVESTVAEAQHG